MNHYGSYNNANWKKTGKSKGKTVPKRRRFRGGDLAKNLVLILIVLAAAGSIGVLGLFAYVSRDLPDPNSLTERSISQSTKIYDRTGDHLLYQIFGAENRTLMKIQEGYCRDGEGMETDPEGIPLIALQATIAAEDRKFCSHHGFSVTGLMRAVIFRGSRGGGSTLTQQLVKNAILSNERTILRKAKELILSVELERRYAKDEILQIYFNEIPYGSTYYGIQSASTNFFDKDAKDLTLAQAATLAALPKAPTTYINNPDLLRERRDWVLDGMAEMGFVTSEEVETAKAEETPVAVNVTNITAPHFVFHIKEQLEGVYGQRRVEEGGLKVITTLDFEKQEIAEEAVRESVEANGEAHKYTNASLVAIDPKNGQILAMVGSKDYFDDEIDGQVNVSTRLRQPGSSIKPIIYAKGFEMGYTPNTVLWDVKTSFPSSSGQYQPNNYDLRERGPIRVRDALQLSLNIPAVKMLYLVGVGNALDFAEKLGYTSFGDRSRFGLALVLGGGEVKLLEHVGAYAAFANDGVRHETVGILKVEDAEGQILEEWKESRGEQAVTQSAARMLTNVLADNAARTPAFGAANSLTLGGRPVAAKTGTTNDYRDAWTVGYTPSLAAGVWAGNNDNSPMNRAGGSLAAAPIWNAFMRRALEGEPIEPFPKVEIPQTGKAVLDGNLDRKTVIIDKASGKLATEFTPEEWKEERLYAQYHSILHYVNRSNPTGPVPENPSSDPYYEGWEKAIAEWIARKEEETGIKVSQEAAPTEYDDVHIPENFPRVQILSPEENTEYADRAISISVNAEATRGITRVEFYLDGYFLGSDVLFPYRLDTNIPNAIPRGYHTLRTVAYDDVGNVGSDTVGIRVQSDSAGTTFEIIDPKNGQTIERTSDTFMIVVSLQRPADYRIVTVTAEPVGAGDTQVVGAKLDPQSPFLTFEWGLPNEGQWVLSAIAEPRDGGAPLRTPGILVRLLPAEPEEEPEPEPMGEPLLDLDPFTPAL